MDSILEKSPNETIERAHMILNTILKHLESKCPHCKALLNEVFP